MVDRGFCNNRTEYYYNSVLSGEVLCSAGDTRTRRRHVVIFWSNNIMRSTIILLVSRDRPLYVFLFILFFFCKLSLLRRKVTRHTTRSSGVNPFQDTYATECQSETRDGKKKKKIIKPTVCSIPFLHNNVFIDFRNKHYSYIIRLALERRVIIVYTNYALVGEKVSLWTVTTPKLIISTTFLAFGTECVKRKN